MIRLFKKAKKLPPCPICGAPAEWDEWTVLPKNEIRKEDYILIALRCSQNRCFHTSYWRIKDQAIYQWERKCKQYSTNPI